MSQPEPLDFGKNINQEEASQLAMRGALDTIHKLQEITEGLRAQLRDTSNQNKQLQEQVDDLRTQRQAWQANLQKSVSPESVDELKHFYEVELDRKTQALRAEGARLEARLKEDFQDKEIRLMQQWMEKENRLTEEFREQLREAEEKLETQHAKHQTEITEIEKRWEAYAHEKQIVWETRAKESLAEIQRYDNDLMKSLLDREMTRLEGRLSSQAEQISILEKIQQEKQQALAAKELEKTELQKQIQELASLLKQSRQDQDRATLDRVHRDARIAHLETEKTDGAKRYHVREQRETVLKGKLRQVIRLLRQSREESIHLQTQAATAKRLMEETTVRRADVSALRLSLQDAMAQHAQQRLQELSQQIHQTLTLDLSL